VARALPKDATHVDVVTGDLVVAWHCSVTLAHLAAEAVEYLFGSTQRS
jgi:hypothetical protein